jgi:DNA-binding transcriptional MocR family regulator
MDEDLIWEIRAFVYSHFAETTRPPSVEETASRYNLTHEDVAAAYGELNQRHAFFLQPGTHHIAMAWPFSASETPFKVHANAKTYFANCAWDSLGISVVLEADAEVEASCAQSGKEISITVRNGEVRSESTLVHFLVPFKNWYNDLPFT